MSPALNHFSDVVVKVGRVAYIIVCLYRVWPRMKHLRQGFKKLTPEEVPIEQTSDHVDFRTRLMLCLFFSFALCFMLSFLFLPTFMTSASPPDVTADPAPAPPPPKIARSSTARGGDIVTIVCGGGKFCALATTAQDAIKLDRGQIPTGKAVSVKNGTKAVVTGYDPEVDGSDTADVSVLAGADAVSITLTARSDPEEEGYIPGRWMHKLRTQGPKIVYQVPSTGAPGSWNEADQFPSPPVRPLSAGRRTGDSAPE